MGSFITTWIIPTGIALLFILIQSYNCKETYNCILLFKNFFNKKEPYRINDLNVRGEIIPQLEKVGYPDSDLNNLIGEINHYIEKTKGTTDFSVIQNKVERKLTMRYDQSTAKLSFPTYIGLMGTFAGVFLGISMFIYGFDGAGNITDISIKNLLTGMLVSMITSLWGLLLTTFNTSELGNARKLIEEDKNEFYDFIQTELMPSLDVSMVVAITKLHQTVDKFEPAFDRIINRFQTTFDNCTKAFGDNFEVHVNAVARAVDVMGRNMDKVNENINLQEKLLDTLRSNEFVKGMDKYIVAANHFVGITQALNKFEEARRMMLAAAQEAIALQNTYNESLKIPKEIAVRINQILDRIKEFETNVNAVGASLTRRDILADNIIERIENQIQGIARKGKIADRYLGMSDGKLEELYTKQIAVIGEMNNRYKLAIEKHIDGFERMIGEQTAELERRHKEFIDAIEERFNIESIRAEFVNLRKLEKLEKLETLDQIEKKLNNILNAAVNQDAVHSESKEIQKEVQKQIHILKTELEAIKENTREALKKPSSNNNNSGGGFFSFGRR